MKKLTLLFGIVLLVGCQTPHETTNPFTLNKKTSPFTLQHIELIYQNGYYQGSITGMEAVTTELDPNHIQTCFKSDSADFRKSYEEYYRQVKRIKP